VHQERKEKNKQTKSLTLFLKACLYYLGENGCIGMLHYFNSVKNLLKKNIQI